MKRTGLSIQIKVNRQGPEVVKEMIVEQAYLIGFLEGKVSEGAEIQGSIVQFFEEKLDQEATNTEVQRIRKLFYRHRVRVGTPIEPKRHTPRPSAKKKQKPRGMGRAPRRGELYKSRDTWCSYPRHKVIAWAWEEYGDIDSISKALGIATSTIWYWEWQDKDVDRVPLRNRYRLPAAIAKKLSRHPDFASKDYIRSRRAGGRNDSLKS